MNKSTASAAFSLPFDYRAMMTLLDTSPILEEVAGIGYLGESILGSPIPIITLGQGTHALLYVGAHHGMESLGSILLCRFLLDFAEMLKGQGQAPGCNLKDFCRRYTLYIIPMLNPDGVEYAIHGIDKENPLYDRLLKMNGNSTDFSHWQANARGVDLNHNYDCRFSDYQAWQEAHQIAEGAPTLYGGLSPESEPEVAQLCNFIRFHPELCGVLSLHTRGEEIYYCPGRQNPDRISLLAAQVARLSGYRLSVPTGSASYSGMCDWCGEVLSIPAFTLECGKGHNPMPMDDWPSIYFGLRELFFKFPLMF